MKKLVANVLMILICFFLSISVYSKDLLLDDDLSVSSIIQINEETVGVNGLGIIPDSELYCQFYIRNTGESRTVSIILATYTDDGKLVAIQPTGGSITAGDELELNLNHTFLSDTVETSAKILFWDALNNLVPLRSEIEFDRTTGSAKISNVYHYDANNCLLRVDKPNGEKMHFQYDNNGNLISKQFEH